MAAATDHTHTGPSRLEARAAAAGRKAAAAAAYRAAEAEENESKPKKQDMAPSLPAAGQSGSAHNLKLYDLSSIATYRNCDHFLDGQYLGHL